MAEFLLGRYFDHQTINESAVADGAAVSKALYAPGAEQLTLAVKSDGTYSVTVEWYDDKAYTTKVAETSVASGVAGGTTTEKTVQVASPFVKVVVTDGTSDAANAAITGSIHVR